jgi:signal transduction histidine kinase
VRKDGSRFYANELIETIRDDASELAGFAKITRDITAQREAQIALDETREQLAQAQKMEALGQLTGGIAHDFNNLLMIVSGYAQILQRKLSEPKDVQAVEAIRAAAGRGEKLTRQLLTFSRRQQLMPVVVDLHAHIGAVRDMLAPSLRGNIELVVDIEDKIWPVEVDLGELELALVNIAVNARDAMPEGGTITLQARNVVLTPGSAAGALEGDFVALAIIDTGTGIPEDVLQRVFEPFYTTKPVGKGTGLGLSQVHGFANQSGGAVTVASEPDRGTVVTLHSRAQTEVPAELGDECFDRTRERSRDCAWRRQPRRRRCDFGTAGAIRLPRSARRECRRGAAPSAAGHRIQLVAFGHCHAGHDGRALGWRKSAANSFPTCRSC